MAVIGGVCNFFRLLVISASYSNDALGSLKLFNCTHHIAISLKNIVSFSFWLNVAVL